MIPTGMMRIKAIVSSLNPLTVSASGQVAPATYSVLYTPIVYVESAYRNQHLNNMGLDVWEKTIITAPWFPNLLNGMRVGLVDGLVNTVYQIESIEDDRSRHRWVKMVLVRAEKQ